MARLREGAPPVAASHPAPPPHPLVPDKARRTTDASVAASAPAIRSHVPSLPVAHQSRCGTLHAPVPLSAPYRTAALLKAAVPIDAHDAVVQLAAAQVAHGVFRVVTLEVLDKAKPARCLSVSVEPHHNPLDLTTRAEKLIELFFCAVEGEIADV
eukprot:CAMPEP_0181177932 /NCGR_PEP_ID=MMETSP1096-20121128/5444_1 /TAXON_ID=156174 ORGANISM="Chrysochromulina ericina, Strain CCMP281" /NCGR_SAMPLE_ID=MMETSP1096 /ASSEMBLY_ACC=CAM_ASM_000453 /LENGTH=154 /DNA_ID=CAMNT_0023266155 /DNA_START=485 /DNA_END=950 /DNA_ORIENTATION=-